MLTLYQFSSCPFCWKIKALLHLIQIPYNIVEVTPFGMPELKFTAHKKVPVLLDDDQIIVESNVIAEYIIQHYGQLAPLTERDKHWMTWVDTELVHYLPPLIHPNVIQSFKNFRHILVPRQFSVFKQFGVRLAGALVMPRVASKMRVRHQINHPRQEFEQALQLWQKEGLNQSPFFAGADAGLVDALVYGVLRSCAMMSFWTEVKVNQPALSAWYERCHERMAKPAS